ncbi:MAG: hypothetical protein PHR35_11215 [Kiritimatiellae bacterium]|nr:hypothetical protein [Kiritimatiellia bacterium]
MTKPSGFWSGGHGAFIKAVREEEQQALAPLLRALEAETDPEAKHVLKDQIKQIEAEFTSKRQAAGSSLFSKA